MVPDFEVLCSGYGAEKSDVANSYDFKCVFEIYFFTVFTSFHYKSCFVLFIVSVDILYG